MPIRTACLTIEKLRLPGRLKPGLLQGDLRIWLAGRAEDPGAFDGVKLLYDMCGVAGDQRVGGEAAIDERVWRDHAVAAQR